MTYCSEYPCGTYNKYNKGCRGKPCREASALRRMNNRRRLNGLDPIPVLGDFDACQLPFTIDHDQRWTHEAACADLPSETFFDSALEKVALSICSGCKVIEQCLTYAKATDQKYGVWGGQVMTKVEAYDSAN